MRAGAPVRARARARAHVRAGAKVQGRFRLDHTLLPRFTIALGEQN